MRPKYFKTFFSFILAIILTLGLTISFQSLLAAWTAPVANPPTCLTGNPGCDAPLNVGNTMQSTAGALWLINSAYPTSPYGLIVENGNVGIGAVAPGAKLQINPPSSVEGLRIVTASNYSPLNIRNSGNTADIFRVDQNGSLAVGAVPWARLTSFPSACASGQFVTTVGASLTCAAPPSESGDAIVGNEITNVANATLTRTGSGSAVDPYLVALNLGNANTWSAAQTFSSANTSGASYLNAATNVIKAQGTATEVAVNYAGTAKGFTVYDNTTSLFRVDSAGDVSVTNKLKVSGNVGIGSADPGALLDMTGNVSATPGANQFLQFNDLFGMRMSDNNYLIFDRYYSGAWQAIPIMTLERQYGNVGVGTVSPGAKLEVAGQIKITGGTPGASKVLTSDAAGLASWQTLAADGDGVVGNEVTDATNATLTRSGDGTAVSPYTLGLNLGNDNTWSAAQTFSSANTSGASYLNAATNVIKAQGTATEVAVNYAGTAKGFTVYDNTTSLFRVDSAGDVSVAQKLNISGKVGIRKTAPDAQLQVNAPSLTEGLRIVSASNYSPLNIRESSDTVDIFRVDQDGVLQVGDLPWARLVSFPAACASGQFVTGVSTSLSCATPATFTEVDAVIGNEVTDVTNATLARSGSGTAGSPYTLGLNLGNANTWSVAQTYSAGQTISSGNLTSSQTANSYFYFDANRGVQIRVDADNNTADEFAINNGANTKVFTVDESGNVTATAFIYSSDQSLKENIKTIPNALESILKLRGVDFNWRQGGAESLGVVAQEVEKVYPQLVHTDERTGLKSVEYGNLVAPIIEAIKEQQKQIEELKKQNLFLQQRLNEFKK